jgi:hypothetical protein
LGLNSTLLMGDYLYPVILGLQTFRLLVILLVA